MPHLSRPSGGASRRAMVVAAATLAYASACTGDDPAPTAPQASPIAPHAAIVSASVVGLPFEPFAINNAGQVVGYSGNPQAARAYLWTPGGAAVDLGTLGGASSWAYAVNELGQVAGASLTAEGEQHAFLWTPGTGMQDLGTLPGATSSIAHGINDLGQVVGESTVPEYLPPSRTRAFLWTPGLGMQDLGTLGGGLTSSAAFDINNTGHVVGRSFVKQFVPPPIDPETGSRAFLWAPGQGMRDLGTLGGGQSIAYAINDAGQVVGRSYVSQSMSVAYHAFTWTQSDGMRDLGVFGADSSSALGINSIGQIAGWSTVGVGPYYAVYGAIWTASEGMESITQTTGIGHVRGINDRQQIVGDRRVATLELGPGNAPPLAHVGGPYGGLEGSAVGFDLSGADRDGGTLFGTVDYGDGYRDFFATMLPYPYPYSLQQHVYADNGAYALRLIVTDGRGARDTATTTVTVANVPPTIVAGSLTGPTAPVGLTSGTASVPIAFEFTDPARRNDVYSAEITCGNGVVLGAPDLPMGEYSGVGTYAGACVYTSAGIYTIGATVSDEDGGTSVPAYYRDVIVYDPAGAYTMGSGFYAEGAASKGKTHFTFSAKFIPGASLPDGAVRLWGGAVDFESTALEMLVASGSRAVFWGTGWLNGTAARFRITVVDGGAPGRGGSADAIRVEVWDGTGATVLFDTQPGTASDAPITTAIEGGNIQVRR